nr:MAG TPA: hypothetical protein [Caudoviricetes sp.]
MMSKASTKNKKITARRRQKQIFIQDQYNTGRRKSQYEYQKKTYS